MRKSRTSLRDLLLPAVATRADSDARTRPVTGNLAKNISSPFLVSSTNVALDPYYLEPQQLHQPDSPAEASQFQTCLSGAELSYAPDSAKRGSCSMRLMMQQLHVPTLSTEHGRSLTFSTDVGDPQDIPDLDSAYSYSSDSTDPDLHPETPPPLTIPRITLEDLSDSGSATLVEKTYDFKIAAIGASVRQGDFLQLPSGSHVSSSLSSLSPQEARRLRVRVCHNANHSDMFFNPYCRPPVISTALEDLPETSIEGESETGNQFLDTRLRFVEDDSPYQQSESSVSCATKVGRNTSARGASNPDGLTQPSRIYPALEPSAMVHFRGKHRRSRAASYHVTTGTLTERGDLYIQPFSGSPNDSRWSPKNGMMVVKVYIPSTDDIWAAYFPTDVTISMFTLRWLSKLNLRLRFSGSTMDTPEYYFDDNGFQCWIKHRVRHDRNLPIVGHLDYAVPLPCLSPNHA